MPSYDYVCEANGRTVEVLHGMSVKLQTWGEVCDALGIEPGDTPAETPVSRKFGTGAMISTKGGQPAPATPASMRTGGHSCSAGCRH